MTPTLLARLSAVAALALGLLVASSVPARAQVGTLMGKVVDEAGKPVAGATLTFDYESEQNLQFTVKTNDKGEWIRAGLRAVGRWTITVQKDHLVARLNNMSVPLGGSNLLPDIVVKAGAVAPNAATDEEAARAHAELAKAAADADAAIAAGNYDVAIAKYTEVIGKTKKCAACYVRMGDAYLKKNDLSASEKAYQQAIETDPTGQDAVDAYGALAILYNQQRRFDDATKMTEKARSLGPASGGDAQSVFNTGAILWNQGKIADAKAQFIKAIGLNPKLAEAHYSLAMCLVNENKMGEAKASLQQYLTLAPTGQNAATAKAILDTIK